MTKLLVIGCGGFLGAIARYGLSGVTQRYVALRFPVGTLLVNVLGCLVIGGLMAWIDTRQALTANARLFLLVGLLGSFTTFSTFGHETFEYLRVGNWTHGATYVVVSVVIGLAAVVLGHTLIFRWLS